MIAFQQNIYSIHGHPYTKYCPQPIYIYWLWTKTALFQTIQFSISTQLHIIIIIIMSCHKHGYLWPSLATSPNHSSLLAGLLGYIPHPHVAAVCMFELVVLLLLGHMWGSIGVHH